MMDMFTDFFGKEGAEVIPLRRYEPEIEVSFPWAEIATAVLTTAVAAILATPQAQAELQRAIKKMGCLISP